MIFDIDSDGIMNSIIQALDSAEASLTDEMIEKIFNQIDDAIPGVIELLVEDTAEHWKEKASGSGTGWGQKYANAIRSKVSNGEGSIYVDESVKDSSGKPAVMFARMVENGVKSWSIKDALLKSDKAKISKDGVKYMIIPFPVHTPPKKGQGKMSSRFGGRVMDSEVHNLVKNGGRAPKGSTSTDGQDISGLSKWESQKYHSGYGIFRVVSQKSRGWQYPNVSETPVFSSVKDYVEKRIAEMVNALCVAIVKENS